MQDASRFLRRAELMDTAFRIISFANFILEIKTLSPTPRDQALLLLSSPQAPDLYNPEEF
jgi:hypothetical protein